VGHFDDFGVDGRVVFSEDFDVDLVELPVASLLPAGHSETSACIVKAEGWLCRSRRCSMMARTTDGVYSGRRVIDRPPLSVKVYISLVTMSEEAPVPFSNNSVGSMTGALSSR